MVSAIYMSYQSVNAPQGASVQAMVNIGSNGPANGPYAEAGVGRPDNMAITGRRDWGAPANAGSEWDSGWVGVELDASTTDIQFKVFGSQQLTMHWSGSNLSSVHGVVIRAGTQTSAHVQWGNVHVSFARGSTETGTFADSGPAVDTRDNGNDNMVAEQALNVFSDVKNNDSVVVSGFIKWTSTTSDPTELNPYDLFCDILVYSN